MAITTVYFDIGGVLFDDCERATLRNVAERHGIPYDKIKKARDEEYEKLQVNALTEKEYWDRVFQKTGVPGDSEWAMQQSCLGPYKENWPVLDSLRRHGYKLGILSNQRKSTAAQQLAFDNFGSFFDYVVFSCNDDVNCNKPDRRIYLIALAKAGASPTEVLFVDDKPKNVKAAQQLGMSGLVYQHGTDTLEEKLRQHGIRI